MATEPPSDGRCLAEALEDRDAGLLRRLRRRLEAVVRLVRDPQQWSADRYRRTDKLFFAAVLKDTWREPSEPPVPPQVADGEAPQ